MHSTHTCVLLCYVEFYPSSHTLASLYIYKYDVLQNIYYVCQTHTHIYIAYYIGPGGNLHMKFKKEKKKTNRKNKQFVS